MNISSALFPYAFTAVNFCCMSALAADVGTSNAKQDYTGIERIIVTHKSGYNP